MAFFQDVDAQSKSLAFSAKGIFIGVCRLIIGSEIKFGIAAGRFFPFVLDGGPDEMGQIGIVLVDNGSPFPDASVGNELFCRALVEGACQVSLVVLQVPDYIQFLQGWRRNPVFSIKRYFVAGLNAPLFRPKA